jgi:hypothetical protein
MIVASMATLPHRRPIALRAVASLLPQVDELHVWLDKHDNEQDIASRTALRSLGGRVNITSGGDRGDGGKFLPLWELRDDAVWLICDDDLELPGDYAATMTTALHQAEGASDGPCVVGLHAFRLPEVCKDYRRQRTHVQHCLRFETRPEAMTRAHVLGTSSVVTRPHYLRGFELVDVTDPPNVGDLHLAAFCERQGIPRYCLPLPRERWLGNLLPDGAPCIWNDRATKNENRVIASTTWSPL